MIVQSFNDWFEMEMFRLLHQLTANKMKTFKFILNAWDEDNPNQPWYNMIHSSQITLFLNWLTNKLSDLTRVSSLWVNFRKRQLGATNIFYCKNKIKLKRLEPTAADRGSCASIPVRYSPPQPSYSPQAHTTHNQLNTPRPPILWKKIVICLLFTWCDQLVVVGCCL